MPSFPPFSKQLEAEGYPVLLDPHGLFPAWPGKVTVVPAHMIEKRGEELKAFFRSIIRAFWFMRDVSNFEYLRDVEARLRRITRKKDARRLHILSDVQRVESWSPPLDGGVLTQALKRVVKEMV